MSRTGFRLVCSAESESDVHRTHLGRAILSPAPAPRASSYITTAPERPSRRIDADREPSTKPSQPPAAIIAQLLESARSRTVGKLAGVLPRFVRYVTTVASLGASNFVDQL